MIIEFRTENLEWYDISKKTEYVELQLKYKSSEIKIVKKYLDRIERLHHFGYYEIKKMGVITLFYIEEVFEMTDAEKKEIYSKIPKHIETERAESTENEVDFDQFRKII